MTRVGTAGVLAVWHCIQRGPRKANEETKVNQPIKAIIITAEDYAHYTKTISGHGRGVLVVPLQC